MRTVATSTIGKELEKIIRQASFHLGRREMDSLQNAFEAEDSPQGKAILGQIIENADIAAAEDRPLCQDTGVAVVFIDIGQEVALTGEDMEKVIHHSVATAYMQNHLRPSMVSHPLARSNTGDNSPAIIHTRIVPGDKVRIRFDAKGGGCENMSAIAMLTPAAGREGVVDFVVNTVCKAGGNPCPPVVVGVGLGGNFEKSALLAKEALLRPLGNAATDEEDASLEADILSAINASGTGPMGLGGSTTALAVHLNSHPCHIACLPVAVNIDCHSHRHGEVII